MLGFFVIQIHLTYNLPQVFEAERFASRRQNVMGHQNSLKPVFGLSALFDQPVTLGYQKAQFPNFYGRYPDCWYQLSS